MSAAPPSATDNQGACHQFQDPPRRERVACRDHPRRRLSRPRHGSEQWGSCGVCFDMLARESVVGIVASLACCILLVLATKTADAQARQYIWSDIDCRQSRIAPWPGLKCRATNAVKSEGNIGVFRQ